MIATRRLIVFKFAKQIVELEPVLRKEIEIIPSTKTMIAHRTGSVYRAISAKAGTKHGYLLSVVIYDELAQAKSRNLYDVLDTSFGAREEPLFITISTQSNDPEHVLSKLIDDGLSGVDPTIVCHLYAADEDCDLGDEAQWMKANPALGKFRDREDFMASIRKAQRMPAEEPKVRNLFLNQRVAPISSLVARAEWMGCTDNGRYFAIDSGEEVYLALDLSSVADLTALVVETAADPCRVIPYFWKPQDYLAEHSHRDFGAGSHRYEEWYNARQLRVSPGRSIDPQVIATFMKRLRCVGVVVVNALSDMLELRIWRTGKEHFMRFRAEAPLTIVGNADMLDGESHRGTEITFSPSARVFAKTEFYFARIEQRLRGLASLDAGVTIVQHTISASPRTPDI
jgi:phage terminase large subunit-like protein